MNKHLYRIAFLLLISSIIFMATGCTQNTPTANIAEKSTSEENTSKETEENKTQNDVSSKNNSEENTIKSDRNPTVWSNEEHDAAEKAANKFVSAIKNKDMEVISTQIEYPITVYDVDGTDFTFTNQKDFASANFDRMFDEKFVSVMSNSKELSSSWRGFMLGEGSNLVWFNPNKDKAITITNIVTNSSSDTQEHSYAHK